MASRNAQAALLKAIKAGQTVVDITQTETPDDGGNDTPSGGNDNTGGSGSDSGSGTDSGSGSDSGSDNGGGGTSSDPDFE